MITVEAYSYFVRRGYGATYGDLCVVPCANAPEPGSAWDAVRRLTRAEAVERFGASRVEAEEVRQTQQQRS